jgi:hypothetical protein
MGLVATYLLISASGAFLLLAAVSAACRQFQLARRSVLIAFFLLASWIGVVTVLGRV